MGADVNGFDFYGRTPIWGACLPGLVGLLLNRGASPEYADDRGWTPLMWQAFEGRTACVALLLEDGEGRATAHNGGIVLRVHGVAFCMWWG